MSEGHIPNCLSPCCQDLLEKINQITSSQKAEWERIYKRNESFGHRLIKHENSIKSLTDGVNEMCDHDERIHDLENVSPEKRLIRIEEALNKLDAFEVDGEYAINDLRDRVEKIEKCFGSVINSGQRIGISKHKVGEKQPHKCPVCKGYGRVTMDDYSMGEADAWKISECRACEKGVVWG